MKPPEENKEPNFKVHVEESGVVRATMPQTVEEFILLFKLAEGPEKGELK